MNAAYKTVMMKPHDSVAVALSGIPAGTELTVVSKGRRILRWKF